MAAPRYPHDTLPGVSLWRFTPGPNALQSDEEYAHTERRKSGKQEIRTGDAAWTFLEGENNTFQLWYDADLNKGIRRFYIKLPAEHESGFLWHVARFLRKRVVTKGFGYHEVTATLEVYPIAGEPPADGVDVDIDAVLNGGDTSANAVAVTGLDPTVVYRIERPGGRLYSGYSAWPEDTSGLPPSTPNDQKWGNAVCITAYPGGAVGAGDDRTISAGVDRGYQTGELARAAWVKMFVSGSSEYRFWVSDAGSFDNRGGASLKLVATAPPPSTRSAAYRSSVLAKSPIGYWLLSETSGTVAVAEVGNNGTIVGSVGLNRVGMLDRTRGCMKFSGVDGRIQISQASLDRDAPLSVDMVLMQSNGSGGSLCSAGPGGWFIRTISGRGAEFLRSQVTSIGSVMAALPFAGIPFHFGFSLEPGSPKTWRMYVNGTQIASGTTFVAFSGGYGFRIGCDILAGGADIAPCTHFIQDVAVYASVLSAGDFLSNAQAGGFV